MGLANDTDALVRAGIERRRAFDGYTVVEVPERRDFWYGNALVLDCEPAPRDGRAWLVRHADHFAGTGVRRHVIVWEVEGARDAAPALAPDAGATLDRSTVFVRREPFAVESLDAAICELCDDAAWREAETLALAEVDADAPPGLADFERWRFATARDAARAGRLRMWGLWDCGPLVGYAGIYASASCARFATPVTRASHRRRGIFRALCTTAVNATLRAYPGIPVVVCAATGGAPADVYNRLGFAPVGEQYGLVGEIRA